MDPTNTTEIDGWQVYTVKGVATKLQVPPKQVYDAIRRGDLDAFRVGKHLRVTDHALRQFVGVQAAA